MPCGHIWVSFPLLRQHNINNINRKFTRQRHTTPLLSTHRDENARDCPPELVVQQSHKHCILLNDENEGRPVCHLEIGQIFDPGRNVFALFRNNAISGLSELGQVESEQHQQQLKIRIQLFRMICNRQRSRFP